MPVNPQAQAFLAIVAGAPPLDSQTPDVNREGLSEALPLTGAREDVAIVEDRTIDGPGGPIPVRVYRPRSDVVVGGVAYFHGGGWVMGTLDLFDATAREIANAAGAAVVAVDYRLAPEHPFPAALDDALRVTRAMLAGEIDGVDPTRIAVAGDSAGGNLAAVVAQQLRDASGLRHQALIYPVTKGQPGTTASYEEFAEGYFLTQRDMQYFFDCYAPGVDPSNPLLAPLEESDLARLPSATIITAECDPLRDEGEAYARRLADAGVQVELRRFPDQIHGFFNIVGVGRRSRAAVDEIAAALKAGLA